MKFWVGLLKRTLSRNKEDELTVLKWALQTNSKKVVEIILSVLTTQNPFKKNAIKIYIQYFEFLIQILHAYKKFGYKKRVERLMQAVGGEVGNLPKDTNLKKVVDRFFKTQ